MLFEVFLLFGLAQSPAGLTLEQYEFSPSISSSESLSAISVDVSILESNELVVTENPAGYSATISFANTSVANTNVTDWMLLQ